MIKFRKIFGWLGFLALLAGIVWFIFVKGTFTWLYLKSAIPFWLTVAGLVLLILVGISKSKRRV